MFRTLRRGVYALIVVGLLGLNVATLVSVPLFSFLSMIVASVLDVVDLGASTVQAKHQQKLRKTKTETERHVRKAGTMQSEAEQKRRQEKQRAEAAEQERETAKTERDVAKRERDQAKERVGTAEKERDAAKNRAETAEAEVRDERKKAEERRNFVDTRATKIEKRAVRTAARNIGSIPLEVVPLIGIGTVVGVTYLDLKAVCETMTDMAAIRGEFGLKTSDDEAPSPYCGGGMPSPGELWQKVPSWGELWDIYRRGGPDDPVEACMSELGPEYPDARGACEEIVQAQAEPEGRGPIPDPGGPPPEREDTEANQPPGIPNPDFDLQREEAAPPADPMPTPG